MEPITQLDVVDLERAIAQFDVGELISHAAAAEGIENSNYFLRTLRDGTEHEYVLTIMEQPSNAGEAYVPLLDFCFAAGLPVARIIRTTTGDPYQRVNGKSAVLSQRLPGGHVDNPTYSQIEALGRFAARLHCTTPSWDHSLPSYPRTAQWFEQCALGTRGQLPYQSTQLIEENVQLVVSLLARADVQSLPRGVIHGDLFRDNVLFNATGLTGVLDFHHAANGYLIYDLSVAANDWCTDATGMLDVDRAIALLRAYHRIRPLAAAEIRVLPAFLLYAALSFWLSRLMVDLRRDNPSNQRCNNPAEFQRIVMHHRAHFFYLDERLLLD